MISGLIRKRQHHGCLDARGTHKIGPHKIALVDMALHLDDPVTPLDPADVKLAVCRHYWNAMMIETPLVPVPATSKSTRMKSPVATSSFAVLITGAVAAV